MAPSILFQPAFLTLLIWLFFLPSLPSTVQSFLPHSRSLIFREGKDSNSPQQVHISLAGTDHIRVSWITKGSMSPSVVQYGTVSGSYTFQAEGGYTSYSYPFFKSGLIHNVVVGPLEAGRTYYYRCGGVGSEYVFKAPPAVGSSESMKLVIFGDPGQTESTKATLEHIGKVDHDVLILAGDLSYADYYQPLWDSFGKLVEPLASSQPWMVTGGNHDVESIPLMIAPFKSYNARWKMPYVESASDSNLYYSFESAGVHVVMLGSYTDYSINSNQYRWLKMDLAKVDRSRTPWLFAVVHAPWYNSNAAHQGEGDKMMDALEPLLMDAKVDILFAGHVHAYERTTRVYQKTSNPYGINHITVGTGGNGEGLAMRFLDPKPSWSQYREASYGFGMLEVVNATHAHWRWHRNQDDEGIFADDVWLESSIYSKKL